MMPLYLNPVVDLRLNLRAHNGANREAIPAEALDEELVTVGGLGKGHEATVGVAEGVAVAMTEVGDQAEVERVVSAVVLTPRLAGQPGERAGQPGCDRMVKPHGLPGRAARESPGGRLLLGAEHVDTEGPAGELAVRTRGPGDADQDQRRVEGDRGERVDGEPAAAARPVERHDGDPGHEPAQARAQCQLSSSVHGMTSLPWSL